MKHSPKDLDDYRPRLDFREVQFILYALRKLQETALKEVQLQRRLRKEEYELREKAKIGCMPEFIVWSELQKHLRNRDSNEKLLEMINEVCISLIERFEALLEGRFIYPRWLPERYLTDLILGTKNVHIF